MDIRKKTMDRNGLQHELPQKAEFSQSLPLKEEHESSVEQPYCRDAQDM